ncbi:MAG: glycosyltransferase family 4 protein [Patescibacteria group bacterium]
MRANGAGNGQNLFIQRHLEIQARGNDLAQGADIFVIPSVKEGMPYVLLEAMAAGLPIVATNVGGIPEIIKDGQTGLLVPPKNPEKLAAAIGRLIDDPGLRNKLATNARKKVKKYSLSKMLAQYQELLVG